MFHTRRKILLVEDNEVMRTLLQAIIRNEDYEIVGETNNGISAVDMAKSLFPDIICMDLEMPKMNGIEALREIKKSNPEIKVIMVTAHSGMESVQGAITSGAVGYIVKPFNAAKVLNTLSKISSKIKK